MKIKTILPFVVTLAIFIWPSAHAGEEPKPADAEAGTSAEAEAKADYETAEKAAKEAEAAVGPSRDAMRKADVAYAQARKTANTTRQQATDAESLAGEPGLQGLKRAEANLAAAVKALTDAANAKSSLDKALADAKAAALPLQQAHDLAEKAAKEAEAVAKAGSDAANKLPAEAKRATAQATAKRRVADTAKASLARAQRGEQKWQNQANDAAKKLPEVQAQKRAADAALAKAKKQVATAAKAALAKAQQGEQAAQARATAAAKMLTRAMGQKKLADAGLANFEKRVAAAATALAAAEKAARRFEKFAEEREEAAREAAQELLQLDAASRQAAEHAAAKRKVAGAAKATLDPKQRRLDQAAVLANRAAQTLARAQARKESAEAALADLEKRIASARKTHLADERAAKEAEAVAAPLEAEARKTRAAFLAARNTANNKRALAQQAKAALRRLVAARQMGNLMESPDRPKTANRIDEIVFAKLKALGIQPILCSDAVFVRRAHLDLTGTLPSAEEAKTFIESSDQNKRVALVDRLLDRSEHADYWAMRWSDILRIKARFPTKVWPNAAQAYHRWVWESIARNKPYDQFARELLTSSGSNFRVGPVNFYRAVQDKTPEGIAAAVGLALMGTRVHLWPEDRRAGMAAFFSQVGYKPTGAWNEEIVFWDPLDSIAVDGSIAPGVPGPIVESVAATNQIPRLLDEPLSENGPLSAVFPDGVRTTIPPNRNPRAVFADWLINAENPWFAKAIVNRTWAWAMGRGIIHEPDDVREDNPASNPELLTYLEKELIAGGYDLEHLKRQIFTSTAYQFSSIPRFKGPEASANFASYPLRRVEAEVLIDALDDITGSSDLYTSVVPRPFAYIPTGMSAVALADGSVTSPLLTLFGRSARTTGMENERVNELARVQWLHLLNSATIQGKLQRSPTLAAMFSSGGSANETAEDLYLTILSRFPTETEVKAAEEHAETGVTRGRDVWVDLAWALVNTPEFLLRH